jgi:GT2 family glycosyltransferase
MGKHHSSKKTKSIRRVLVSIIYHNQEIDLESLLNKIKIKKQDGFLIIFDNIKNIFLNKKLKKKYKNINFVFGNRKTKKVPYYRNQAVIYGKKKYEILLFLDSDVLPDKNIVEKHYNAHLKYNQIPVIGGTVKPSFTIKQKSIWEKIDGCMSWFTSLETNSNKIVKFPYHLPTCNISIKLDFLKKNNIKFDSNLITGEDVDFCNKIKKAGGDLLLLKKTQVTHLDRINFKSFLQHQKNWGKHHYYLRYKNNYFFKKKQWLFYFSFFIFYPFLIPFISLVATYLNMRPLLKYRFSLINLTLVIYLIYFYKGFFTYLELFTDFKIIKLFRNI